MAPTNPSLEGYDIPSEVSKRFQTAFGLDEPPVTLAAWAAATSQLLDTARFSQRFDKLCQTPSSRHQVRIGGLIAHYQGVFDTLLLPFIYDVPAEIVVRSKSPLSDRVIEIGLTRNDVTTSPADAVISFGVATDVVTSDYLEVPSRVAYYRFNQYTNAFSTERAYKRWTDTTQDAVSMPLPVSVGFALARQLMTGND